MRGPARWCGSGFGALLFAAFMIARRDPVSAGARPGADRRRWSASSARPGASSLASLVAYFSGEFCNSFVLAKMKILTSGRASLWMRTIGSTIVGEAVDSLIFYPVAFLGLWPQDLVLKVMARQLPPEGRVGGREHAVDLPRRELPEAGRERGLLRPQHELHAVLPRDARLHRARVTPASPTVLRAGDALAAGARRRRSARSSRRVARRSRSGR